MLDKLIYASIVFTSFLAIMNPISSMSIFLSMTENKKEEIIKKIAFQSILTAFLAVVIFSLAGHFLLSFFGITLTALRLTGGILVALIGYNMLQGESFKPFRSNVEEKNDRKNEEVPIAITPLGIPLLAGPGVIITAMNFAVGGFLNCVITVLAFGLLCTITYYVFIFGKQIKRFTGKNILKVITRMMGLILAVIGVQMILDGVYNAFGEFPAINYFKT